MQKVMVTVNHLQKGMYVAELDRPWLDSPFIFQGFRITNANEIIQLQDTCEYVYVDKDKSIVSIPQKALLHSQRQSQEVAERLKVVNGPVLSGGFEQELPNAWDTYKEALSSINKMVNDARTIHSLNSGDIKDTVISLSESVMRHPDALTLLCSLKDKGNFAITHAINTCVLSLVFGRFVGFEDLKLIELGVAALLHDIGEIMVPTEILIKRGEKTMAEKKVISSHTRHGAEILTNSKGIPQSAVAVARDHHERENGSGYPNRLTGKQLSMLTKIVSVVDVYDTLTGGLYGKTAIDPAHALKYMYEFRGQLLDTEVVEKFIQCLGAYPIGSVVEFQSGEVGIVLSAEQNLRLYPKVLMVRDKNKNHMLPPRLINLALMYENGNTDLKISRVVAPEKFDVDVRKYIWRDLNITLSGL